MNDLPGHPAVAPCHISLAAQNFLFCPFHLFLKRIELWTNMGWYRKSAVCSSCSRVNQSMGQASSLYHRVDSTKILAFSNFRFCNPFFFFKCGFNVICMGKALCSLVRFLVQPYKAGFFWWVAGAAFSGPRVVWSLILSVQRPGICKRLTHPHAYFPSPSLLISKFFHIFPFNIVSSFWCFINPSNFVEFRMF